MVKVYIEHNKNSPIKAAGTMSPASKRLGERSADAPDAATLSQNQTRRNHTFLAGFGTYCQDEENRPNKGPDDVGLNVQPAMVVCHILVKGSCKGHAHDNDWKACRKKAQINPREKQR